MLIGIIYGAESGSIRRVINVLDEAAFDGHLCEGEALLKSDDSIFQDGLPLLDVVKALVEQEIGRPSLDSRCVLLDSDFTVTGVVQADPLLDSIEDAVIIRDQEADVGWTLPNGEENLQPPPAPPEESE